MKVFSYVVLFGLCAGGAAEAGNLRIDLVFQISLILGAIAAFVFALGTTE